MNEAVIKTAWHTLNEFPPGYWFGKWIYAIYPDIDFTNQHLKIMPERRTAINFLAREL